MLDLFSGIDKLGGKLCLQLNSDALDHYSKMPCADGNWLINAFVHVLIF